MKKTNPQKAAYYNRLQDDFSNGKMSRRSFMRLSASVGVLAVAPLALGSRHAEAQASERYDYIVIGAGSAGCALAARLSEDPGKSVLVIEAGPADENQFIHIPAAFPNLFGSELDWGYTTEPQTHASGKTLYVPRGKMYGGSSSINAMIYNRANPKCYDRWAEENPGWTYEEVLPLFKRSENNERGADEAHGAGGPLNIADQRDPNILSKTFVTAAVEAGYAERTDFNAGEQEGFGLYQVTQKGGLRHSAAAAFLHPAFERDNIAILAESHVQKLLIEDGKCSGVRIKSGDKILDVTAEKEIILSAGAIGSPQILMLSGVGPKAELDRHTIELVHDLPGVGQNLQDHFMAPVAYESKKPVTLAHATEPEQAELLGKGMGLLTSNIGEAGGYLKVLGDSDVPDLQFHFAPVWFLEAAGSPSDAEGFTLLPGIVGTNSTGQITLRSADPADAPKIDPNCFGDERDLEVMIEGVKIARKIMMAKAFDEFRGEERYPGPDVQTDDEIKAFLHANVQTIYHPVGTCKMGSDPMSVVGADLKVHGIAGLRVADASIMPSIVNGNTHAPSVMIGEKCADLIKATHMMSDA